MSGLVEAVARIARHEAAARAVASVGQVTEAHSGDAEHAVTVRLRDTGLVLSKVPVAVGILGYAAIPAVDDLVLVVFCEGDRNAPVVVGRLYHPGLNPPDHADGQVVLSLPAGEAEPKVRVLVEPGENRAVVEIGGEMRAEITDALVHLRIDDELSAKVDSGGGGRVELSAGGSSLILKKNGDVTLKAAGKLELSGTEVAVSGTAKVAIKGAIVELN